MEGQETRQPKEQPRRKKEKKRERRNKPWIPLPLACIAAVLAMLAFVVGIVIFWIASYFFRTGRDLAANYNTTYNMVQSAQTRAAYLLDQYIETNGHKLFLAARIIERGYLDGGEETTDWVFGSDRDSFFLYDIHGNLLKSLSALQLGENDERIYRDVFLKYYKSDETRYAVTDFGSDVFFETLSDGNVLMYIPSSHERVMLLDSLYDVEEVLTFNMTDNSLAFVSSHGVVSAAPEGYAEYQNEPIGSVVVPASRKYGTDFARVYAAEFNDRVFLAIEGTLSSTNDKVIYLTDVESIYERQIPQIAVVMGGIFVCALFIMYFVYQSRKYIRTETRETNGEIRLRANILVIVSCVIVFLLSYYTHSLYSLSLYTLDDRQELQEIRTVYEKGNEDAHSMEEAISSLKKSEATVIGNYLSLFPEARTKQTLRWLSEEFGLEYLILFDQNGNEVLCDGDYINLSLSADPDDLSYRFRSLLNGKQSESSGVEYDDLSCRVRHVYGASLRTKDNQPDGLILCANGGETLIRAKNESSLKAIADEATNLKRNRYYMIDADTHIVTYSPIQSEIGQKAENIGFTDKHLDKDYSGSLYINDEKFSISQIEVDGQKLFVALSYNYIYMLRTTYSVIMTLISLILFNFFIRLMEEVIIHKDEALIEKEERSVANRYSTFGKMNPDALIASRKTLRFVGVILTVYVLFVLIILLRRDILYKDSITHYVLAGKWHAGPNIFALTAILIMVSVVALAAGTVRYCLILFSRVVSNRALTYIRLLISAIDYLSVIFTAYFAFRMLGGDVSSLLATSSALALVIGMGAEDITKDIIAGIFLMFEGEFQVGDTIEVDGMTGTVKEVGLTTTKMVDPENNILILKNSAVRNLINHTLNSSYTFSTVQISSGIPIPELEQIFDQELPAIQKAYPAFVSTPFFKGARNFSGGKMEITVAAQVKEKDRVYLESVLNRELKKILDRHGIQIG